jgi:hypothetical protein
MAIRTIIPVMPVITIVAIIIPVPVVIAFSIHLAYFPPAFILQETDLSLFFKPAEKEIPSYSLNLKIILLVDPGYHHIPSFFHEKPVVITSASIEIVIGFNYKLSFVITFVKVHLVVLLTIALIVLLIILLTIALIVLLIILLTIALIILSVIPGARLSLGHGECSNCE